MTNFTSEKKRPEDFDKYREIHQKAFQQYSDIQTKQTKFESVRNKHLTYVWKTHYISWSVKYYKVVSKFEAGDFTEEVGAHLHKYVYDILMSQKEVTQS